VTKLHLINRAALPLHADLLIAGAHCALATNTEEIIAATSRWHCPSRPRSNRTFDLELLLDPSLPNERDVKTQTHFRGLHHLVFATVGSHEVFTFDLARRRVVGAVSQASASDANFWNAHWLPITIGVMGTTVGVTPLHSACLDHSGWGLLLAGNSGAGKSTLTVALARAGFSLISDDWTYISRDTNAINADAVTLTAHGLGAPVKLLPDAVRHFPELITRTPKMWFNGELAFELTPEEICGAPAQSASRPRWLLFLERTSQPGCTFLPLTTADARLIFESSAERLPTQLPEACVTRSATIAAVATCSAWRIRSGESPQATAESIRNFCERN
jgi:hypothetical protein